MCLHWRRNTLPHGAVQWNLAAVRGKCQRQSAEFHFSGCDNLRLLLFCPSPDEPKELHASQADSGSGWSWRKPLGRMMVRCRTGDSTRTHTNHMTHTHRKFEYKLKHTRIKPFTSFYSLDWMETNRQDEQYFHCKANRDLFSSRHWKKFLFI